MLVRFRTAPEDLDPSLGFRVHGFRGWGFRGLGV